MRERRWPALAACAALLFIAPGAALGVGCGSGEKQAFQCGVALENDDDFIRYCEDVHEVCVCETNYCATRDASCASGYRYLEPPFGPEPGDDDGDRACVEQDPGEWIVPEGRKDACPAQPEKDAGAGEGGGARRVRRAVA